MATEVATDSYQYIGLVKDVVLTGAAMIGAYVALSGLKTWKKQHTWKENRELAKKILKQLFVLRTAIAFVRHPMIMSSETNDALTDQDKKLPSEELEKVKIERTYMKRWIKISDAQASLHPLLLESEVAWGKDLQNQIDPINEHLKKLAIAINVMLRVEHGNGRVSQKMIDKNEKNFDVLYDGLGGEDKYAEELENLLSQAEDYLKKHLDRKS